MKNDGQPIIKTKQLIDEAARLERAGKLGKAIGLYSEALDVLVAAAKEYAEKSEPAVIDAVVGTGILSEQYLMKFNGCLKKDDTAAVVSNAMGKIFAKMGNNASARAFFEQAIDLTPKGAVYDDPHIGMQMLE